ncbi:hypothetical protein GCM10009612_49010 [Streptomyces beijiangensis]
MACCGPDQLGVSIGRRLGERRGLKGGGGLIGCSFGPAGWEQKILPPGEPHHRPEQGQREHSGKDQDIHECRQGFDALSRGGAGT